MITIYFYSWPDVDLSVNKDPFKGSTSLRKSLNSVLLEKRNALFIERSLQDPSIRRDATVFFKGFKCRGLTRPLLRGTVPLRCHFRLYFEAL